MKKQNRLDPKTKSPDPDDLASTGEALLTSSAADENALESKEIRGSFFSHHLVSGLRGAADSSGDGQVTLAEASSKAIENIARAVGDKELPAMFLLGDRYVGAMQKLATSQNTKTYVLPADLLEAVQGILHR